MRYRGNKICSDERMDAADGKPENIIMHSPTVSSGEGITNHFILRIQSNVTFLTSTSTIRQ